MFFCLEKFQQHIMAHNLAPKQPTETRIVPFESTQQDLSNESGPGTIGHQHKSAIWVHRWKKIGKSFKNVEKVWNVHKSGPKAPTKVRTPPIRTRGYNLDIKMGFRVIGVQKKGVMSILKFWWKNLWLKRKMIITWSKINFLGSGGKVNVEKSVRNVIIISLWLKGGKK